MACSDSFVGFYSIAVSSFAVFAKGLVEPKCAMRNDAE